MNKQIDLLIVGTQKAGTSSLLRLLEQHPKIKTHSINEIGFFIKDEEYKKGFEAMYGEYFDPLNRSSTLIAKNVGVFENSEALERAKKHNPDMKIVVS